LTISTGINFMLALWPIDLSQPAKLFAQPKLQFMHKISLSVFYFPLQLVYIAAEDANL
jgi:hypothetical protein